jgi:hypothetical protein
MPRYRFQWKNHSTRLLQALCQHVSLLGEPAEALITRYGVRPKEEFIRDTWQTLIQYWLGEDKTSSTTIENSLREARLGDLSIGSQSDYFASCRNSGKLREIVLDAFIKSGEHEDSTENTLNTKKRTVSEWLDACRSVNSSWAVMLSCNNLLYYLELDSVYDDESWYEEWLDDAREATDNDSLTIQEFMGEGREYAAAACQSISVDTIAGLSSQDWREVDDQFSVEWEDLLNAMQELALRVKSKSLELRVQQLAEELEIEL